VTKLRTNQLPASSITMTLLGLLLVLVAFEASEAAPKQSYDIYGEMKYEADS
jgi:hypothetical protein